MEQILSSWRTLLKWESKTFDSAASLERVSINHTKDILLNSFNRKISEYPQKWIHTEVTPVKSDLMRSNYQKHEGTFSSISQQPSWGVIQTTKILLPVYSNCPPSLNRNIWLGCNKSSLSSWRDTLLSFFPTTFTYQLAMIMNINMKVSLRLQNT